MNRVKWFFHPVAIFIFSIVALGASLFLYIYWYLSVSIGLQRIIHTYNLDTEELFEVRTWVVILVLSILVALIFIGVFIIFVYNQKIWRLYALQRNFIDSFTHELKTPVTSMRLYLETFAMHELPREDQLRYLGFMIQDADRLLANINRILNLARIESGSYKGAFAETNLVQVVKGFVQKNADLFPKSVIRVHEPGQSTLRCSIDAVLFEMLLMNLVGNAVKYNRSDPPTVDIRFDVNGAMLNLRVEDNGIGLERGEIRNIFRKFYRAGKGRDLLPGGSGLGLYMVQQIARLHGGGVKAESEGPGKGSIFTVNLPCRAAGEGAA